VPKTLQNISNFLKRLGQSLNDLKKMDQEASGFVQKRRARSEPELIVFIRAWWQFLSDPTQRAFFRFENAKGFVAESLYKQRGKFARPFIHSGMMAICAMGVILAPVISEDISHANPLSLSAPSSVLAATTENPDIQTLQSDRVRDKKTPYEVQNGDTLSTIAQKFNISQETIMWQNDFRKNTVLKPGQTIDILPDNGVIHKVEKGETIYSISKKFDAEPQAIVDYPFNTFVNDETFALAVGEEIFVPNGTPPSEAPAPTNLANRRSTPDAGVVSASGDFAWPTVGQISQGFSWYHTGIDIANRAAPDVVAADSGTVVATTVSGIGYGIHVIVDHGNGYQTLYAHLSQMYVTNGQSVRRGDSLGRMGNTGRSTGIHLHFEVRSGGQKVNPLNYLK
jgi:murein DD-endopeptidase MepM/ murein hydrolase activator NlpD